MKPYIQTYMKPNEHYRRTMRQSLQRLIICLAVIIALPHQATAQIRGNNITVTVTPDHKDWTYRTGEKATFTVCVLKSGTLLDNTSISYELGPEMYPEVKKDMVLKRGSTTISGTMKRPGFLKLRAVAHVGGKDYEAWCSAAFSPEKIQPTALCPKDFDAFWTQTIAEARNTALMPHLELLPERSTADVLTYHVSFQNDRWGRRVYGILNVPAKAGRYPALLRVPGAGVRPYQGDEWTARKGVIVLEIGIHAIPVTNPQKYYDDLFAGPLADYWHNATADRYRNYYRHVITGCIRSIDFIEQLGSLPTLTAAWDGKNLGVTGSSQGGFLTIATTALDKRVTCYAPIHAAMCDYEAALHKQACGWPHYYYDEQRQQPRADIDQHMVNEARYYDGVNFARRITVPGYFSFGYNDNVVPPTTAYGTYNVAGGDKTFSPYQQTAHFWYQEQWDEWQAYLLKHLGVGK